MWNKEDEMWITIRLPETGSEPLGTPRCPYCKSSNTRVYERIIKRVKHPNLSFVSVVRRRCERCGRTFRHYAPGVSRSIQTVTVKALNALLYSLGLSYSQIVTLLGGLGVKLVKSTVWRSVKPVGKKAYYLHNKSLRGEVKIKGMATNLFKKEDGEQAQIVEELLNGQSLDIEFAETDEGKSLASALICVAKKVGAEFTTHKEGAVVNERNETKDLQKDAYVYRLRKGVKRRYKDLTGEAERLMKKRSRNQRGKFEELLQDCRTILDIVEGKEDSCEAEFWEIYKRYAWAKAPHKGETASLWYKMRLFTLRLWDESSRILRQLEASRNVEGSRK
jgi:transposase-like protein